jgi:hypothetical protein
LTKLVDDDLIDLFGNPKDISRSLEDFSASARLLSADRARLVETYPRRWVAVRNGRVAASAETMESLLASLRKHDIPPEETCIGFIDRSEPTLIL